MKVKYVQNPPGVLVAVGASSLELALRLRPQLWPAVPIVFCMVDEPTLNRLDVGPGVTGHSLRLRYSDMLAIARLLVPNLKHLALVGDQWEKQTVFRHFGEEIPSAAPDINLIDLVGLPLAEVRQRVAALPSDTAILYTAVYSDGAGTTLLASEALSAFADVANAPIVGAAETFVGAGATGGIVMRPALIGSSAGQLALRILNGESASGIPVVSADALRPIFDWRQLKRWGVSEAALPVGSEIRFRNLSPWDRYRREILAIAGVILVQAATIAGLMHQRRRRRAAELAARQHIAELAHFNRQVTISQLSTFIAHELNQPIGAILNNVEAAILLIHGGSRDDQELNAILLDIKRDDQRAGEIIKRLRQMLTKGSVQATEVDINQVLLEVLELISGLAIARHIEIGHALAPRRLSVIGDRIQLGQVFINLLVNAVEAISSAPERQREIICRSRAVDGWVAVSIRDSGPGISSDQLERLFEPFSTTKAGGLGMGLCIAREIVQAHGGKIIAESQISGAVFHVRLPLVSSEDE